MKESPSDSDFPIHKRALAEKIKDTSRGASKSVIYGPVARVFVK
jgi:hypothetical protein